MLGVCAVDSSANTYGKWDERQCFQTLSQGHGPQRAAGWQLWPPQTTQQGSVYRMGKTSKSRAMENECNRHPGKSMSIQALCLLSTRATRLW